MLTTDSQHPDLRTTRADGQQNAYLVLSAEEIAKGFVRPVRTSYMHLNCETTTRMGLGIAETYARNPGFYGATYCCKCCTHRPLSEFIWEDGSKLGS